MNLAQILAGARLRTSLPEDLAGLAVEGLEYDSRRVRKNTLFFAFQGRHADGRSFAQDAVAGGALAVVSELPRPEGFQAPWIEVEHGRQALALAARRFYGAPDERLVLTGITGTNGKTTVAYLVDSILSAAGKTTALVGTIEYRVAGEIRPAPNTTPESLDLYRLFSELEQRMGSHVTMEVSSHALALGRVYGIQFHTAVFTNLTVDHLDFHQTMEQYSAAKQLLFEGCGAPPPRYAAVNLDDPYGRQLTLSAATARLTYALEAEAMVRAAGVRADFGRPEFRFGDPRRPRAGALGPHRDHQCLQHPGRWLRRAGRPGSTCETIAAGIEQCRAVPGRFERVDEGQPFTVVVDYAHTDDALRNAIRAARGLEPHRVITLFGCGGDRDRTKRPLMGAAAAELSDFVVLTSDNPRSEDPLAIMNDAMVGIRRYDVPSFAEPDREKAIYRALSEAGPGDLVLLAGKGHETYQILQGRTIAFDDREVARRVLRGFGYGRRDQ